MIHLSKRRPADVGFHGLQKIFVLHLIVPQRLAENEKIISPWNLGRVGRRFPLRRTVYLPL